MAAEKTLNRGARPKQTYVDLIKTAITNHGGEGAALQDIYESIQNAHSYFSPEGKGWKNSVRHTLSLNPAFVNVPRTDPQPGKGGLWRIDFSAPEIFTRKRNPKPSQKMKQERAAAAAAAAAAGNDGAEGAEGAASALPAPPPAKRARKAASSPKAKASSKGPVQSTSSQLTECQPGPGAPAMNGSPSLPPLASPPRPTLSGLYPGQAYNQFGQPVYLPNGTGHNVGQDGPLFFSALFNNPGQPSFDQPSRAVQQQQQQPQSLQLAQLHTDGSNGAHSSNFPSSAVYASYQMPLASHLYGVNPSAGQLYSGGGYAYTHQQQMPSASSSSSNQLPHLHLNPLSSSSQGGRSPAGFPYQTQAAGGHGALISPQQPFQQGFPSPDQSHQLPPNHHFSSGGESSSGLGGINNVPSNNGGGGQQTLSGPHSRSVFSSYEANQFRPPTLPSPQHQQHFPPHNMLPGSHFPSLYVPSFADQGHSSVFLPDSFGSSSVNGPQPSSTSDSATGGGNAHGSGGQQEPLQHHLSGHSTQSSSSASTPQQPFENSKSWGPPPPGLHQPPTSLHSEVLRQRSPLAKAEVSLATSPSICPPKTNREVGVPVTVANSA